MPKVPERLLSPGEVRENARIIKRSRGNQKSYNKAKIKLAVQRKKKSQLTIQAAQKIMDRRTAKKLDWIKNESL